MGFFDIVGSLLGFGIGAAENNQNLAMQRENMAYMRKAQGITWAREDNAIQRRVADLKAAGLSPTLAAGSAAATSAPINTSSAVPRSDMSGAFDKAGAVMALLKMKTDISKTNEEMKNIALQREGLALDNTQKAIEIEYRKSADPFRVKSLSLETDLAEQINPMKVAEQAKKLRGMDLQAELTKVDTELKRAGIDLTRANIEWTKYKKVNEVTRGELLTQEIEYKRAMKEMAQKRNEMMTHDYDIYRRLGLPSNQAFDTYTKGGIITGKALGELILKIMGK